ncbi:MauE/DoxX family redox-associated membrane protein [Kribbella sp. NPDC056861]|uniref:MauE/DoxX family redox-associated membrane protein n=1 Tax=Kribbella sp. NPDC056861 TaxID=3154857 RepID=UPI0034491D70
MLQVIELLCRSVLVVVLLTAAASKLRSRRAFSDFAASLAVLVPRRSRLTAAALTSGEVLAAVGLVVAPLAGYAGTVALFAALSAGVALVLRRRLQVRCRCFGAGTAVLSKGHLVRNLLLTAIAMAGLGAQFVAAPDGLDAVAITLIAGGAVIGFCLTRWDDLSALLGLGQ